MPGAGGSRVSAGVHHAGVGDVPGRVPANPLGSVLAGGGARRRDPAGLPVRPGVAEPGNPTAAGAARVGRIGQVLRRERYSADARPVAILRLGEFRTRPRRAESTDVVAADA